jgi:hypothetical protein
MFMVQIEGSNGFLPIVLQILASEESELGARQAGNDIIYFLCLNAMMARLHAPCPYTSASYSRYLL